MYREKIKPKPRSDKWLHLESQEIKSKVVFAANTPRSSLIMNKLADSKQVTSPSTARGVTAAGTTRRSLASLEKNNILMAGETFSK